MNNYNLFIGIDVFIKINFYFMCSNSCVSEYIKLN